MKTAKHECSSLNIVAKAALGIMFAFAISFIDSPGAFAQEVKGAGNIVSSQSISISQAEVERINVFIKFLASNNVQERILAIKVLESFALQKQFPPELVPALVHIYDTDKDSVVVRSAAGVLFIIADSDTTLTKSIIPRVTVIVQNESQRNVASSIVGLLKSKGYSSEIVKRAFHDGGAVWLSSSSLDKDLDESEKISDFFEEYKLGISQWDDSMYRYYLVKLRPRHFELWLPSSLTVLKNH